MSENIYTDRERWSSETKLIARYEYRYEDGRHAYYVDKGRQPSGEKAFRIRRVNMIKYKERFEDDQKADILPGLGDARPVLYRLPELIAASADTLIHFCEGEKDVETLVARGYVATTAPFGAKMPWRDDYTKFFRDRDVLLFPDNDDEGREHMDDVARKLYHTARSIKIVRLPGLKVGGDVTDWIEMREAVHG
ncbi:hypothetical protein [Bradyrhizobium elkanii]|uniref:hypothetical protein n=1 Tax=Bradyrhizobium elkanii TaxID=29448 RepID=UPI0014492198|nr:hypothetical protein [Bradyrhizobium elkanii]MCS3576541.1 hypothetical protein [Bradyrhizobium elkanii]MCS3719430.1 hypothetical protein [Bradyrhizobium elkanii]MCS4003835.1 hypothetical protein [Bradyrhizobium elkanii USDA 61]BBB98998.1 hypothetical protein BE61_44390 [Bradyrhizobium elkanii USDA 61]